MLPTSPRPARAYDAAVGIRPVVLIVPSLAAAVELPRRLAGAGPGLTGLYPFKVLDLARAVAEPSLLGRGLKAWDPGHDALLAARLLDEDPTALVPEDVPRAPLAAALARTLSALRLGGVEPKRLESLAAGADPEDAGRLASLARIYRRFLAELDGHLADPATRRFVEHCRAHDEDADRPSQQVVGEVLSGGNGYDPLRHAQVGGCDEESGRAHPPDRRVSRESSPTSTSIRGRNRQRPNAAAFARSETSSPAPPSK